MNDSLLRLWGTVPVKVGCHHPRESQAPASRLLAPGKGTGRAQEACLAPERGAAVVRVKLVASLDGRGAADATTATVAGLVDRAPAPMGRERILADPRDCIMLTGLLEQKWRSSVLQVEITAYGGEREGGLEREGRDGCDGPQFWRAPTSETAAKNETATVPAAVDATIRARRITPESRGALIQPVKLGMEAYGLSVANPAHHGQDSRLWDKSQLRVW